MLQYHEEPGSSSRTEIMLGKWDPEKHVEWLEKHPSKKPSLPAESRRTISHYYSGGASCDQTGIPRSVEVRLKCIDPNSQTPSAVALYLLEPKTCEYVLGVESNLFCPLLKTADDHGRLDISSVEDTASSTSSRSIRNEQSYTRERSQGPTVRKVKATEEVEVLVLEAEEDQRN